MRKERTIDEIEEDAILRHEYRVVSNALNKLNPELSPKMELIACSFEAYSVKEVLRDVAQLRELGTELALRTGKFMVTVEQLEVAARNFKKKKK